jgi:hypothetical protein
MLQVALVAVEQNQYVDVAVAAGIAASLRAVVDGRRRRGDTP